VCSARCKSRPGSEARVALCRDGRGPGAKLAPPDHTQPSPEPSPPLDPGGERWPIPRPLAPLIAQLVYYIPYSGVPHTCHTAAAIQHTQHTQHTVHSHSTQHTAHSTQHTAHSTQHTSTSTPSPSTSSYTAHAHQHLPTPNCHYASTRRRLLLLHAVRSRQQTADSRH
jgi:hypothetical protein